MNEWPLKLTATNGPPVSMFKLGDRPWLFEDEFTEGNSLKRTFKDPLKEVFLAQSGNQEAGEQVLSLIKQSGMELVLDNSLHPLERAGLSVQEDLCLVHCTSSDWILAASLLSSLWKL